MIRSNAIAALCCALLCLAAGEAVAGLYKCRQGEGIVYQQTPCPPGSASLSLGAEALVPDPESVRSARSRARADIAAAEEIRRREAREDAQRKARQAEAEKHAQTCARLLAVIRDVEADNAREGGKKGSPKKARSERRKYMLECGPL